MEEQIRQILPEKVRQAFDDIVEQRVLGASKHIAMIGEMFEAIADRGLQEHKKPADIIEEIKKVADYFIATRGEASQAVSNAIWNQPRRSERFWKQKMLMPEQRKSL